MSWISVIDHNKLKLTHEQLINFSAEFYGKVLTSPEEALGYETVEIEFPSEINKLTFEKILNRTFVK